MGRPPLWITPGELHVKHLGAVKFQQAAISAEKAVFKLRKSYLYIEENNRR
jgi:hypothetical protein